MRLKLFFTIFLFSLNTYSQDLDSLIQKFQTGDVDEKIQSIYLFLPKLSRSQPDSTFYFIKSLNETGLEEERDDAIAFANYFFADYLSSKSLFDEAFKKLDLAMDYFYHIESDTLLSDVFNLKGNIYFLRGDVLEAEKNYLKSMKFARASGKKRFEMHTQGNYARVLMRQERFDEAADVLDHFYDFYAGRNQTKQMASAIGLKAQLALEKGEMDKAIEFYERSLELNLADGTPLIVANGYTNIAIACYFQEQYERAEQYFRLALSYRKTVGHDLFINEGYHNLGDYFHGVSEYDSAIVYYNKVIERSETNKTKIAAADAYEQLANIYETLGIHEKQAEILKKLMIIKDQIMQDKNSDELALLRMSYESDKAQMKNTRAQREESLKAKVSDVEEIWRMWILTLIIIIIAVLGFYSWKKIKHKKV